MKVFLDDVRFPSEVYGERADEEWTVVSTVDEVYDLLRTGKVTHLSLDNDLGTGQEEGHKVLPWMMQNDLWPSEELYVHSANPYWRGLMETDIRRYFYGCVKPQMLRERNHED